MSVNDRVKEIRYGTPMHETVLKACQARRRLSDDHFSERKTAYAEAEDRFQAYVPAAEIERLRKEKKDSGGNEYVTIEIPFSLAMLLTAHNYWSSTFLGRTPVYQFSARHGGPMMNSEAMEALIDYQMTVGEMLVAHYIWLMDVGKYGIGIVGSYWADEYVSITKKVQVPRKWMGLATGGFKEEFVTERVPGYMGNRLYNIRPQNWYPDPRVSTHRFQDGEFCGRVTHCGWNHIVKMSLDGWYFNVEALKNNLFYRRTDSQNGSTLVTPEDTANIFTFMQGEEKEERRAFIELFELVIELVPSDWHLGSSEHPEKWVFTVANDSIVVGCQPLGEAHGKFPFDIIEYEIEGYGLGKRSMLEIAQPLNDTLTWLFNSHMYSVRKTTNGVLAVDPSRVVMKDLLDPEAAGILRLRPDFYGTDVRMAVSQLETPDTTQTHLRDAAVVTDMMQRLLGVTDQVMGMMSAGGRRTAAETRQAAGFGVNRLKTNTEYFSAMGFGPLAQKLVQRTQQYYDESMEFKIAGDLARDPRRMRVTPEMIAGFWDFVPVDGTLPVDKYAMANLWKEIMLAMGKLGLGGAYDMLGILEWVGQLSGLKNLKQFRVQVVPDGAMPGQVAAGNSVPIGGQGGQISGGNAGQSSGGGSERNLEQVSQVGSIPGMGPAG